MVDPDPKLTEAAARDLARPQSYDRGENYYDEGAVVELVRRGETIRATVGGRDTRQRTARRHVEIFLYAERYDEAIAIADRFSDYKVVEPVVEAAWEEYPHWTIDACKEQAEPIIEEGQSQRYRHAVDWLEYAGKAAQASGDLDEWRAYVEEIKDDHYRKYKLRPMLEDLLKEFSG